MPRYPRGVGVEGIHGASYNSHGNLYRGQVEHISFVGFAVRRLRTGYFYFAEKKPIGRRFLAMLRLYSVS
jgi:hypothetical protein